MEFSEGSAWVGVRNCWGLQAAESRTWSLLDTRVSRLERNPETGAGRICCSWSSFSVRKRKSTYYSRQTVSAQGCKLFCIFEVDIALSEGESLGLLFVHCSTTVLGASMTILKAYCLHSLLSLCFFPSPCPSCIILSSHKLQPSSPIQPLPFSQSCFLPGLQVESAHRWKQTAPCSSVSWKQTPVAVLVRDWVLWGPSTGLQPPSGNGKQKQAIGCVGGPDSAAVSCSVWKACYRAKVTAVLSSLPAFLSIVRVLYCREQAENRVGRKSSAPPQLPKRYRHYLRYWQHWLCCHQEKKQ